MPPAGTGFRGPGLRVLLAAVLTLTLAMLGGLIRLDREKPVKPNWFPAVIQGDISQRRNANTNQAQEALEIYLQLSRDALAASRSRKSCCGRRARCRCRTVPRIQSVSCSGSACRT